MVGVGDVATWGTGCDVVQATCNLLALLGVDDLSPHMAACLERQRERGRL